MHNTFVYIGLLTTTASVVGACATMQPILLFCALYTAKFLVLEYIDIFTEFRIWRQDERTAKCYDWLNHYLKNNYGIINGKQIIDLSESLYFDDLTISAEKALQNKYEYIYKELELSDGKSLLDCGCGDGTWMLYCKERGVNVMGLTLSTEQLKVCQQRGLNVQVQDYRVLNKNKSIVQKFDAISLIGSTEHISILSGLSTMVQKSYRDYKSAFSVLKQYLKPNAKIVLTVLVQNRPKKQWRIYDFVQCYVIQRHYGGYYSKPEIIKQAISDNGFTVNSIKDYTRDYHWISVAEPVHFGHWWIHWEERTFDKIIYFMKGLLTDPFLIHHWLYYWLDSWMYHIGGYQKVPLTQEQVENSLCNLKYFTISL